MVYNSPNSSAERSTDTRKQKDLLNDNERQQSGLISTLYPATFWVECRCPRCSAVLVEVSPGATIRKKCRKCRAWIEGPAEKFSNRGPKRP